MVQLRNWIAFPYQNRIIASTTSGGRTWFTPISLDQKKLLFTLRSGPRLFFIPQPQAEQPTWDTVLFAVLGHSRQNFLSILSVRPVRCPSASILLNDKNKPTVGLRSDIKIIQTVEAIGHSEPYLCGECFLVPPSWLKNPVVAARSPTAVRSLPQAGERKRGSVVH